MDQLEFLKLVVQLVEQAHLNYMIVGSYASGYWGEPRSTYDVDIVVMLAATDLPLLERLFPPEQFYMSSRAALDAIIAKSQFNVIHPDSGNKVDFMIASETGWAKEQLARRRQVVFSPGFSAWVGASEDVIISKMLYYREGASDKHLRDITGMLKVSGDQIDRDYVTRWATELEVLDIWQAILKRVGLI